MGVSTTILGIMLVISIFFNLKVFKENLKVNKELDKTIVSERKYKQEILNVAHDFSLLRKESSEIINNLTEQVKCVCEKQVSENKPVQKKQVKKQVIK